MENEATLLRQDIAELDAKINELKNRIEARAKEFNREVQERESDPMWQVAATDYIQKGDRSGLENYHNTKLMAEQTLVDRINGFDTEYINLNKDKRTLETQIEATRKSINATQDPNEKMALESRLKELEYSKNQVEGLIEMNKNKKENAISLYERKYNKKIDGMYTPSSKPTQNVNDGGDDSSDYEMIQAINDLKDEANEFKSYNTGSKSYTKEEYNKKKKELLDKCKKYGIKGKAREDIIAELGEVPTHTKLEDYKITSKWNDRYNAHKNTVTRDKNAIVNDLQGLIDAYDDPYGRDELYRAMQELLPQTQQGKLEQGLADDRNAEIQEWNKNKTTWINAVKDVTKSTDRSDKAQSKHQAVYEKLNEYGKKQMEKLGYHWDGKFWNIVKKGDVPSKGRPKGFGG